MRKFSKMLAFALAAAMVFTAFAPAAKADAAEKAMAINKQGKILYVTDGTGINDAATLNNGKGNVSEYDFAVSNKPADYKEKYTFTWLSSDEKVITVGKAGLTKAVGVGTADVLCVVTEKATGNSKLLKNTITVKANADKVAIKTVKVNGEEVAKEDLADMGELAVGTVVDLDRVMYDKAGNDTTKKGTFVTDSTRWFAKDAEGKVVGEEVVKITNKNGQFKFLVPGEYTLYCETYQSNKYEGTTASTEKDDPIVVTIAEFKPEIEEIEQTEVKKFTIKFDRAVKSLGAVTVKKLTTRNDVTVANTAYVKGVTPAKDGMSAEVEMYADLQNNTTYEVTVADMKAKTFLASKGLPFEMVIYVDAKEMKSDFESVYINADPIVIKHALFDEKGVNVTDVYSGATVVYSTEKIDTEGKYYAYNSDSTKGSIWFSKEGLDVNVLAKYTVYVNQQKIELDASKVFYSDKKDPVEVTGVADWKISGTWGKDAVKEVPLKKDAKLELKYTLSDGSDPVELAKLPVGNSISFEALTPNVAALKNGNEVVFYQKNKVAEFAVYNSVLIGTNVEKLLIGVVTVKATDEVALGYIELSDNNFVIGAVDGYDEKEVTVKAMSNYQGVEYTELTAVSIEGVDENGKKAAAYVGAVGATGLKVTFNGYEMLQALKGADNKTPAVAQFTFKVKGSDTVTRDLVVTVKDRDVNSNYISVVKGGDFGKNIARTVDSKDAKVGTFTVCNMSNGIQTNVVAKVDKYLATTTVTADAYYFTVVKDGKDITEKFDCVNGVVSIAFSGTKDDVVTYDLGAGNYVFTLYKGVALGDSGKALAVQQAVEAGSVTCDAGKYGAATQKEETVTGVSAAELLKAFEIKDTKGETVGIEKLAKVNANTDAADYVFITSFVFRDTVTGADGVTAYAEYTVPVGYSLPIKKAAN